MKLKGDNLKIATFYTLAEPEKLCYPYLEAIESCCQYSDVVMIYFASNKKENENFRKFETTSHEKITNLCNSMGKDVVFLYEENWPSHGELPYERLRGFFINGIKKAIDVGVDFWVKVDADNTFPRGTGESFRAYVSDLIEQDYVSFSMPRKTVLNKEFCYLNKNSRDTYGFNLRLLKHKDQNVWLENSLEEWLRYIPEKLGKDHRLNSAPFIPSNYDCFFFDKQRVSEFWKLSYDLYRFNGRFDKDVTNLTESERVTSFAREKLKKAANSPPVRIHNHDFLEERINNMGDDLWGFNNFGFTFQNLGLI